ncbi:MAG: hypothetical protein EOP23_20815 [Hyphomicrobiales bacterium]|nr:MAG: hypothetical protein EOP23_20815 [Hyphomicrobiales bacterium]
MLITALGIPSAFAAWGFEAVRCLAQVTHPDIQHQWVDRADPFEHGATGDRLVCSNFPSRALREALSVHQMPTIVFTTSALDAVNQQRLHHAVLREAVGAIGASITLIGDCHPQKHALFLDAPDMLSAEAVICAIATYLGQDLSTDLTEAVLATAGPMPAFSPPDFPEAEEGIVTLVLENSLAHLRDACVPLKSIWPHRVFLAGDRPNEEAPLVAEAAGGSRILFYGPYFHLAEGRWRAKLTLGFTKEAVGLPLRVWVHGQSLLGEALLRPRLEGVFAAQLNFTVTDPEHPIEIQVSTAEGAIEGRIALGQVELTQLSRDKIATQG